MNDIKRNFLFLSLVFSPSIASACLKEDNSFFMHMLISWMPTIILIILFILIARKITKRNKDYQDKLLEQNADLVMQIKRIADTIEDEKK